jgi:hypothetical protein
MSSIVIHTAAKKSMTLSQKSARELPRLLKHATQLRLTLLKIWRIHFVLHTLGSVRGQGWDGKGKCRRDCEGIGGIACWTNRDLQKKKRTSSPSPAPAAPPHSSIRVPALPPSAAPATFPGEGGNLSSTKTSCVAALTFAAPWGAGIATAAAVPSSWPWRLARCAFASASSSRSFATLGSVTLVVFGGGKAITKEPMSTMRHDAPERRMLPEFKAARGLVQGQQHEAGPTRVLRLHPQPNRPMASASVRRKQGGLSGKGTPGCRWRGAPKATASR